MYNDFEKIAKNRYTKYVESANSDFDKGRRLKALGAKPNAKVESLRKNIFNKDVKTIPLNVRLNKFIATSGDAGVRKTERANKRIDENLKRIEKVKVKKQILEDNANKLSDSIKSNLNFISKADDFTKDRDNYVKAFKKARNKKLIKGAPLVLGAGALASAGVGYGLIKHNKAKFKKRNEKNAEKTAFEIVNESFEKIAK